MATSIIVNQKSSLFHPQTLNNYFTHHSFKSNPISSLKFRSNPNILHIKLNNPKPSTLLKPSSFNPPQPGNNILCAFNMWGQTLSTGPGRSDFRVASRRRPGSKKKTGRLIVTLECSECSKNRYTTEKRRSSTGKTVNTAKKGKRRETVSPEMLELSKYCPNCRKHQLHKEIKK